MSGHGHGKGKPAWHPGVKPEWQDPRSPENEGVPPDPPKPRKDPGPQPRNHEVGDGKHRLRRRFDPVVAKAHRRKILIRWLLRLWIVAGVFAWLAGAGWETGTAIGAGGPALFIIALILPGG